MHDATTLILANDEISPGYFRMRLLAPGFPALAAPGQFVMVRPQTLQPQMLRRPFGIYRVGTLAPEIPGLPPRDFVEIIYKVVGKGTATLSELHAGDRIELLGPLGRGFSLTTNRRPQILVGGGIGLVPLYILAEQLLALGHPVRLLLGGRTRDDILCATEFERLGVETYVSTDDGSLGEAGFVTRVLERTLGENPLSDVYACGPMPMLNAVAAICAAAKAPLQVSLEAHMACGVGACLGCVVKGAGHSDSTPRYLCTCKAGPVFAAEELDWNRLATPGTDCQKGCA